MTDTKTVSRSTFVWGHVATILVHVLIGVVLLWVGATGTGLARGKRITILVLSGVLVLMSLLAFAPVLNKKKYTIK